MKKIAAYIFCFVMAHTLPVMASSYDESNIRYSENCSQNCNEYPAVSELEKKVLGRSFDREDIYNRLSRLENKTFGTVFAQESLYDRLERLKSASSKNDVYANNSDFFGTGGSQIIFSSGYEELNNSYATNSCRDNQTEYSSVWDILSNILLMPPGNYHHNYGSYSPEMINELNRFQNSQLGTGASVKIIE